MGKTGKWIRNFLIGKKDKEKEKNDRQIISPAANNGYDHHHHRPTTPISIPQQPTTPKEKRRWSFRRSSAAAPPSDAIPAESDTKKHAMAVAVATAAAADAAVAAAKAAAAVIHLTTASGRSSSAFEDAAATMIQSVFRGYLARKALNALRGLVKLQALVRGHLVRKQATATLRCMQALVTVQSRARAQRLRMAEEIKSIDQRQFHHRKSTQENKFRNSNQNEYDRGLEENIKIVEMDLGDYNKPVTKARSSYSNHRSSTNYQENHHYHHHHQIISPSQSAASLAAETSPRACSNHFDDRSFGTPQSSPQCRSSTIISKTPPTIPYPNNYPKSDYAESLYSEFPFYPSYMANTESSRAKARSHSAPKQRPVETFERQPSSSGRRRPSLEGRNVPRAVRMQRSSSQVGPASQNYQYPWSVVKLDRSAVSLKDSECGSTSTMLTNTNYCRSLVGFDVQGARY
ncbi:hypothetical protein ACP275_07G036500 [Erythranthe tilingii]